MRIYHYTSIQTLALILKNKTLRLNCAKNVNDSDECITKDFGSLQKYCFVSCWTKNEDESIPFWKIYADGGRGVRLESDTDFIHFRGEKPNGNPIRLIVDNVNKQKKDSWFINLCQNKTSMNHYFVTKYSDEKRRFQIDCSTKTTQQWIYDIESAFNTKKTCWSFEEEVRFILLGCRMENQKPYAWETVFNGITTGKHINDSWVDLILEQDFFDNLKITTGPLASEADKIIVKSLISYFGKNIKVSESIIKMREVHRNN